MLLAKVTPVPLFVWLPLVNVPFVAIGYRQMGRAFAVRSALAIAGLSAALAYIAAAKTLDFVIYGLEEYTAITIMSPRSALIRERIVGELERGVTVSKGYGGLTGAGQAISTSWLRGSGSGR